MQHQEPTTASIANVDRQRLRASLRLCFAPEQADALVERVDWDAEDARSALTPVIRPARLSYGSGRLLSPLQRSGTSRPPLAPRFGLGSVSALALSLHLGLGLDIETLAALLGRSEHVTSLALSEARRAVEPERITPCAEFVVAIGRYRDPDTENTTERLAFLQHVATCSRCRPALEAARALDERLIAEIDDFERGLAVGKVTPKRGALSLEPALLWGGGALLLLALLVAGTIGVRHWFGSAAPVPLLSAKAATPAFSGWLLQTSDSGDVNAVNLASGQRRQIVPGDVDRTTRFKLAPDQRQIARLTYRNNADAPPTLTVYGLDGSVAHEWNRLSPAETPLTLNWFNNTTVIISSIPAPIPNETAGAFNTRAQETGRLLAFDVSTGAQRELLNGWINGTLVSPDGMHIAILHHTSNSESVVEVRPVTVNGLGAPVTTSRLPSAILVTLLGWTTNNRLIFREQTNTGTTIDSLALDGTFTKLVQLESDLFQNMIGLSLDGTSVVYATTSNPGAGPWTYWQLALDGGAPQKLIEGQHGINIAGLLQVVWSPDGTSLALTLGEPFYMPHAAQTGSATSIASYRIAVFSAGGQPRGSLLDQFANQALLAWLPDDALPPRSEAGRSAPFRANVLNRVGGTGLRPQLSDDSSISPDGTRALIYDQSYDFAMAYPLEGDRPAQIGGPPSDANWLPDGSGGIGVQHHSGDGGQLSRVAIFGDIGFAGNSVTDYDPVQLGDRVSAAYRYPLLAPDGLHCSFVVVDRSTVTLWIGGYRDPAYTVASWQVMSGARADPPLITYWVNSSTLIYAEPGDWRNGLPRRVTLHRVTLGNGSSADEALISWQPHGNERGIALQELRISSDQSQIAVRLRHITGGDPSKDAVDSIVALDTGDLHQSVELARGTPGDGLSWSPDGTQLVAVIQQKLTVFTIRSGGIEQIDTGDFAPSYPLWVLPNEIWYESGNGNAQQVVRATR